MNINNHKPKVHTPIRQNHPMELDYQIYMVNLTTRNNKLKLVDSLQTIFHMSRLLKRKDSSMSTKCQVALLNGSQNRKETSLETLRIIVSLAREKLDSYGRCKH